MAEGSVEVNHFARVFVESPGAIPPQADAYKTDRGHHYRLGLDGIDDDAAAALVQKAAQNFERVEVVSQVVEDGTLVKERRYVDSIHDVPEQYTPQTGPKGGIYYETEEAGGAAAGGSDAPGDVTTEVGYSDQPVLAVQFEDVDRGDRIAFETPDGERDMGQVVSIDEEDNLVTVESGDGTRAVAAAPLEGVSEKSEASGGVTLTSGTEGAHNARYSPEEDPEEDAELVGKAVDLSNMGGDPFVDEDTLEAFIADLEDAGADRVLLGDEEYGEHSGIHDRPITVEGLDYTTVDDIWDDYKEDAYGLGGPVEKAAAEEAEGGENPDVWTYYYGPQGGEGWLNVQTGEIRYQKQRPGEAPEGGDGYGDWLSDGWAEPPDDLTELQVGQELEIEDEDGDEFYDAEVVGFEDEMPVVDTEATDEPVPADELGTQVTAAEEEFSPWEEQFEDSDISLEEYEAMHLDEKPADAPEDFNGLAVGDQLTIELPQTGEEVTVPYRGHFNGEWDSVTYDDAIAIHREDLYQQMGAEDFEDVFGELHDHKPYIHLPEGQAADNIVAVNGEPYDEATAGPPDDWADLDEFDHEMVAEGVEAGDPIAYRTPHHDDWYVAEVHGTAEGGDIMTDEDHFVWADDMDVMVPQEVEERIAETALSTPSSGEAPAAEDPDPSEGEEVAEDAVGEAVADPESEAGVPEGLEPAEPEAFVSAVEEFAENNPDLAPMLTMHDPEEMADYDVFLSEAGDAGVAVSPEGDIQNVISAEGSDVSGDEVMEAAKAAGGETLDCYDGFLTDFYESHGFTVTGTMDFNPEFAPEGWDENPHLQNQPDVMFMADAPEGAVEAQHYDGTEWDDAKADSQRAAGLGEDGGTEGEGVGPGEPGPAAGPGEDGGADEAGSRAVGLWESHDDLAAWTPDDIAETHGMNKVNATTGNTVQSKQVTTMPDGTEVVYTNTDHAMGDPELGERAVASANFVRAALADYDTHGVPQIEGDPQDGYFFSAAAPGKDVVEAPDDYKEAVDPEDFYRQAGIQVLLGNNDAHVNNVKVDEDGNLHWFDMDHAGGSIHNDSALNKAYQYDDGWDRIFGELARTGTALGLGGKEEVRDRVFEAALDVAEEFDDVALSAGRSAASETNEEFAATIVDNIRDMKNGNYPYKP